MEAQADEWMVGAAETLSNIMGEPSAAATLIGAGVTVVGFFVALLPVYVTVSQYQEERRWKRSEFVRSLLSQLTDNPNIALIARILDWREGPAQIPEAFRPLFAESPQLQTPAPGYFEIDWDRFVRSLAVTRDPDWRSPDLYMYRTCFDTFCAFIQGVADDVRAIGVREEEYADLSFYCHRIVHPQNAKRKLDFKARKVLRNFIEHYNSKKTYDVFIRQAEVYHRAHALDGLRSPSRMYPMLFPQKSALASLVRYRDAKRGTSPRDLAETSWSLARGTTRLRRWQKRKRLQSRASR